ncbi:hypothetical protein [Salinicoccus sp. Marseille-QA3877]
MWMKLHKKLRSDNYPEPYGVNMADRWRSHVSVPKFCSDIRLEREKSAEVVVVKMSGESRKERRTEQFYRYGTLDWRPAQTTGTERKSG